MNQIEINGQVYSQTEALEQYGILIEDDEWAEFVAANQKE